MTIKELPHRGAMCQNGSFELIYCRQFGEAHKSCLFCFILYLVLSFLLLSWKKNINVNETLK